MNVLKLIKSRHYSSDRKPLIAFGGAVYNPNSYKGDMIENEKQLEQHKKKIYTLIENRGSLKSEYSSLGLGNWNNLPGTLNEVNEIETIIPGAKILRGKEVNERNIKSLSDDGDLARYKVLHFATHGLVVPEVPELSALVLSQFKDEQSNEDGYLRMDEISKLKIKADFVDLSACETGLGKIYGGEGVVGLTQSFLIAGANGLSVSLWQVSDKSTAIFMTEMYKLVEDSNMKYSDAIIEMKRRFIRGEYGDTYRLPFYWAPFVYYGK
jgi:CHAT domain-containing protein